MSGAAIYRAGMRTLVVGSSQAEIQALIAHRKKIGADRRDEVWEGVLHLAPATDMRHARTAQQLQNLLEPPTRAAGLEILMNPFNLGESSDNFRVPDGGIFDAGTDGLWIPTARAVVEIVSPHDESWKKLPYFASCGVEEVLIVDPRKQRVDWLALHDGEYEPVGRSGLIESGPGELLAHFGWSDDPDGAQPP